MERIITKRERVIYPSVALTECDGEIEAYTVLRKEFNDVWYDWVVILIDKPRVIDCESRIKHLNEFHAIVYESVLFDKIDSGDSFDKCFSQQSESDRFNR